MDYTKYDVEVVDADRTALGKLGLNESTVGSIKSVAKTAANVVGAVAHTAAGLAKAVLPGAAHAASAAIGAASIVRDTASVASTHGHIMGLQAIQADLAPGGTAHCSCDHCREVVDYAISQKTKKLAVKEATVKVELADTASPVPMPLGAMQQAARVAHTIDKERSGTRRVERNRQASLLYEGARGVRFVKADGSATFHGYCVVARAIVDELTNGHWSRWVADSQGSEEILRKLKSR